MIQGTGNLWRTCRRPELRDHNGMVGWRDVDSALLGLCTAGILAPATEFFMLASVLGLLAARFIALNGIRFWAFALQRRGGCLSVAHMGRGRGFANGRRATAAATWARGRLQRVGGCSFAVRSWCLDCDNDSDAVRMR